LRHGAGQRQIPFKRQAQIAIHDDAPKTAHKINTTPQRQNAIATKQSSASFASSTPPPAPRRAVKTTPAPKSESFWLLFSKK
jgi:hypothetical protein